MKKISDIHKEFVNKEIQNDVIVKNELEIDPIKAENEQLKKRILDLQKRVLSLTRNQLITEVSTEEVICIEQIERLKTKSAERELTLEEVKRLDLLVKNLKLVREESTIVVSGPRADDLSEAELVQIATQTEDQ